MQLDELLALYRAAGSGELPALVLIRTLVPEYLDGRGLDAVLADPRDAAAVLGVTRQWAADAYIASAAPIALAAGTQAVGALSHIFTDEHGDPDLDRLRSWFATRVESLREQEREQGLEAIGTDSAVIAMCTELVEDLAGPRREPDPARAVLEQWAARPGAELFELLVSSAWFAATMLAHLLGNESERITGYLDGRAAELYRAADRLRRAGNESQQ